MQPTSGSHPSKKPAARYVASDVFELIRDATLLMSRLTFNVVYEDASEGWVYAHAPDLPEVQTQGEDLDQARTMVRDAIALMFDERGAGGEQIPRSRLGAR